MKYLIVIAAVLSGLSFVACGEEGASKLTAGLESVDVSKLSPDAMKEKASELIASIPAQLKGITDKASAEGAVSKLGPIVDSLSKLKAGLGDKMPDMASLKTAVEGITSKFSGNADIMGVLKPLMDKLTAMLG